jgi:branched-chain amino acid transport system substrate-binding protein
MHEMFRVILVLLAMLALAPAARMAAEDFGGKVLGVPIEIVTSYHQNKAKIGANIAREGFDVGKVDALTDLASSAVGLQVMNLTRTKNHVMLIQLPL